MKATIFGEGYELEIFLDKEKIEDAKEIIKKLERLLDDTQSEGSE